MKIIKETDYRKILHSRINDLKDKYGSKYTLSEVSKNSQLQSSYLTKVCKCEAHLNEDQLFLIVNFLEFDDVEADYLSLLHSYQRSAITKRKKKLESEIKTFRNKYLKTEKQLKADIVRDESSLTAQYFLTPQLQIVHLLLGLPDFQKDYFSIARHLNITDQQFQNFLETLEEMKLIKKENKKFKILNNHFFLSKDSILISAYHNLMKSNSVNRINSLSSNEKYGLSVLFNSDKEAFDQIRIKLINFLSELEKEVREQTSSSEVYQLSIDFFPWT